MTQPNPGSPEAVTRGCTCPVIDNHHGRGTPRGWVVSDGCKLHGDSVRKKEPTP